MALSLMSDFCQPPPATLLPRGNDGFLLGIGVNDGNSSYCITGGTVSSGELAASFLEGGGGVRHHGASSPVSAMVPVCTW